jgi:hypothetical protein
MTHTPGPWTEPRIYRDPSYRPYNIAIYGNKGTATVHQQKIDNNVTAKGFDEAYANARLIAAAPELLAALMLVRDKLGIRKEFVPLGVAVEVAPAIQAAIAKAKGQ